MATTIERLIAEVEANPAGAIAALQAFDGAADDAARDRTARIRIDTDRSNIDQLTDAFHQVEGAADSGGRGVGGFGASAQSAAYHSANLRAVMMGGLGLPAIYGLATGAAGAIQMLGAAAAGAASSVGSLAGILGALPVGFGAIIGGLGATIMGFQGVGGAIKAADVVMGSSPISTGQAAAGTRGVEAAVRGLENAYRSLGKAQEQVGKAERDLARVTIEAAESVADATEAAMERVARAREYAAGSGERVEDAQFAVRDSLISEREAVIALEAAQKRLAEAQKGISDTSADVTRVTDDFTGKTYEVARVSDKAADAQFDQRAAILAVERAQLALERAQDRVGDSQRDLIETQKEAADMPGYIARAEQQAAKDIAKAQERAARSIESAQERVKSAHEGVADALRGVEDAERSLADARAAGAAAAAGGVAALNKYNQAMAALTPIGREFVEFMVKEFMPAWKELQDAAQRGLLPGVIDGLRSLMTVFPMLEGQIFNFAQTVGEHFAEFMAHFAETENVEKLERVLIGLNEVLGGSKGPDGQVYQGILDSFIPLYDIILSILDAATPMTKLLTDDIVSGLENVAATLNTDEGFGKLQSWFERGYHFGGLFMDVLRPLGTVIGDVSEAARPLAEWMLESLADYFEELADVTSGSGMESMGQFFEDMKQPISETMGLFEDLIALIFGAPTDPSDSAYLELVKGIREDVIPELENLIDMLSTSDVGSEISEFFSNVVAFIGQLAEHEGALIWLLDGINGLADGFRAMDDATDGKSTDIILGFLAALTAFKMGKTLLKLSGLTGAFKTFSGAIGGTVTALGKELPWDKKKSKALGKVGDAATGSGKKVGFFSRAVDGTIGAIKKSLVWIGTQIKKLVLLGIEAGKAAAKFVIAKAKIVAGWILMGTKATIHAAKQAAAWLVGVVTAGASAAVSMGKTVIKVVAGWVLMGAQALIQAARMAAAWVIAMGPVGWVIAAVVALGILIWKNWDKIKEWTRIAWDWVWDKIVTVWNWITEKVSTAATWVWEKIVQVWDWIVDKTTSAWDWVWGKINDVWTWIWDKVSSAATWVWEAIRDAWNWIWDKTLTVWDWVWGKVSEVWDWIDDKVDTAVSSVKGWIGDAWDWIETKTEDAWDWVWDKVEGVWDDITGRIETFYDFIGDIKETITEKAEGAFDGIKEAFKSVFNWIIEKWNSFGFEVPSVTIMGKKIGGYKFSTPDIPLWRQYGGPVEEGEPYIVGEKRPELFIPNTGGRIASAVPRSSASSGGGDGITEEQMERLLKKVVEQTKGDLTVEQNFYERQDPLQVSRALARVVKV